MADSVKNGETARDNYRRYCYSRDNGHLDFVVKNRVCNDYFNAQQWDPAVKRMLERQGRPALTINQTFATLMAMFGEQIQSRFDVGFKPFKNGSQETADALTKIFMSLSAANHLNWLETEVAADGYIGGRGFYDVRIEFDDNLYGEVRYGQLNPNDVVIDADADSYDPDKWNEVFVTRWMTPAMIALYYDEAAAKELKARDTGSFEYGYDSLDHYRETFGGNNRLYRTPYMGSIDGEAFGEDGQRIVRIIERQHFENKRVDHFVNPETGDTRPIPETWPRERVDYVLRTYGLEVYNKLARQIKWTVSADNFTLHDEWSPYKHLTPVPFFPIFRRGVTIGMVENLISPQDLLNKSTSQELHIVNSSANGGWQMEEGSLVNMKYDELEQRGAETGLVLVRKPGSAPLEKIQANQVPSGLDRISFKAEQSFKSISGISESVRGLDRADVAARAIEAKQNASSTNHLKPAENLAYTKMLLARNSLDLIQAFYDEPRVFQITGNTYGAKTETLQVNQVTPEGEVVNDLTVGEYSVVITPVPARDTFEQSQFAEVVQMRELGAKIPDKYLVKYSHLSEKNEILQDLEGRPEQIEAEQAQSEIEIQLQQLDAQLKEVDIANKQAEIDYTAARAEKTRADAQAVLTQDNGEQELEMKRQEAEMELQFKREELALRREELEMKRADMKQKFMLERVRAAEQADQQRLQAANNEKQVA